MTENVPEAESHAPPPVQESCNRCSKPLAGDDRVSAGDRVFCRSCYETLRAELEQAVTAMSKDVNYPMALVGALLGATAGVLVWWGFTVLTQIAFGLIAVAIGFLVAHGAMRFAGGKRSTGIQIISVVVSVLGFFAASYLVNMTFINREFARQGGTGRLGILPAGLSQFVEVVSIGFGAMDLVFLAIVIWEGWRIPRPLVLPAR